VVSKDFVRSPIEQAEQDALERIAQDDALDEIVQDAEPGDVIEVHELECDVDDDADVACTCHPLTLRFGAVA